MNGKNKRETGWKQSVAHETFNYLVNFVYLACFFGFFTWYRRLILAEYEIAYLHYGFAIIEALVLAKIIMVGDALRLGGRLFLRKPLIFSTLFRAVVFTIFVLAFKIVELTIGGLVHGKGVAAGLNELVTKGWDDLAANSLVVFVSFIPFFAFKELDRVLGEGKVMELFFRKRGSVCQSDEGR